MAPPQSPAQLLSASFDAPRKSDSSPHHRLSLQWRQSDAGSLSPLKHGGGGTDPKKQKLEAERHVLAARVAAIKVQLDVKSTEAAAAVERARLLQAELDRVRSISDEQRISESEPYKRLKAAAAAVTHKANALEASAQHIQQQLQQGQQEVAALQQELQAERSAHQLATQREEQSAAALSAVHESLSSTTAAAAATQQLLLHSQAEVQLLHAQLDEANQCLEDAEAEVATLQQQLRRAQARQRQHAGTAAKAVTVALAARFAAAQLAAHNQDLQQQLAVAAEEAAAAVGTLEASIRQLQAERDALASQLQAEREAAASTSTQLADTQQELQATQAKLAVCSTQLEAAREQLSQQQHSAAAAAAAAAGLPGWECKAYSEAQQGQEPLEAAAAAAQATCLQPPQQQQQQQQQQQHGASRKGAVRRHSRSMAAAGVAALQQQLDDCQASLQRQSAAAAAAGLRAREAEWKVGKLEAQHKHMAEQHSAATSQAVAIINSLKMQLQTLHLQMPQQDAAGRSGSKGPPPGQQDQQQQQLGQADKSAPVDTANRQLDSNSSRSATQLAQVCSMEQQPCELLAALTELHKSAAARQPSSTMPPPRARDSCAGLNAEQQQQQQQHGAQLSRDWGSGLCVSRGSDGDSRGSGRGSGADSSRTLSACSSWYSCYSTLEGADSGTGCRQPAGCVDASAPAEEGCVSE